MEPYYRDYYRSRLELVDMIPEARRFPVLFAGWLSDEQLLSLIPANRQPAKTDKYMQHCWFKAQLLGKLHLTPLQCPLHHPSYYVKFIAVGIVNPIPMIAYIDDSLNALARLGLGLVDALSGKYDKYPEAVLCRLWADELQAILWGLRLRPSDENTRMVFALYNHSMHGAQQAFLPHGTDPKCMCTDCQRHNVSCTCFNCVEHRKASLIASQIRHSLLR